MDVNTLLTWCKATGYTVEVITVEGVEMTFILKPRQGIALTADEYKRWINTGKL